MFYYIEGKVALLEPGLAVLDCGGVGYELNVTSNTLGQLRLGDCQRLYTYSVIREDCHDLYGFYSREEKRSFEMLIGVSGVGPKAALAILSSATPEALSLAIVSGNEKALMVAPGVGKKIAQRVVMELRDKISKEMGGLGTQPSAGLPAEGVSAGKLTDASAALAVLGYSNSEIAAALKGVEAETMEVQDIVRLALRKITAK